MLTAWIKTRQKLREAYTVEFLATIERAEKQAILARHGLRLLQLLDDTPVVPGDVRPAYAHASQARQILNDAEDDLREWRLEGVVLAEDGKTVVRLDTVNTAAQSVPAGETSQPQNRDKGKQKETPQPQEAVDGESVAGTEGGGAVGSARV
jgi:hypothetical protein